MTVQNEKIRQVIYTYQKGGGKFRETKGKGESKEPSKETSKRKKAYTVYVRLQSRLAQEAIHIRKQKKALKKDVGQLNPIYNVVLSKRDEGRRDNARGRKEKETVSKSKRDEGPNSEQEDERRNNERRKKQ